MKLPALVAVTAGKSAEIDTKWLATPVYPAVKRFPIDTLPLLIAHDAFIFCAKAHKIDAKVKLDW